MTDTVPTLAGVVTTMSADPVAVVSAWSRTDHVPVPFNGSGPMLSENEPPLQFQERNRKRRPAG